MPFPFTFNFLVPGLPNPFSSPPLGPPLAHDIPRRSSGTARHPKVNPIDAENEEDILNIGPGPSNSSNLSSRASPQRTSRKRGWEPSYVEPSQSQTTLASSNGYLDTPAKYRELVERQGEETFQYTQNPGGELDDALEPPAKRRRGLAGSIVSTAVSAALIGTAVGLTVYRLWRDRGKESEPMAIAHEQAPPPPYSETEHEPQPRIRPQSSSLLHSSPDVNIIPPTPPRRNQAHKVPRSTPRRRRVGPSRAANHISSTPSSSSGAFFPTPRPEFDFSFQAPVQSSSNQRDEEADQMDWIGDKLSMLIEEGKRALGREIVVASENPQDEVDDGRGGWVEDYDDEHNGAGGRGRSSSPRRVKRKGSHRRIGIKHSPSSSSYSQPATPLLTSTFDSGVQESPEMKESMERARRKVLEARAARVGASPFS